MLVDNNGRYDASIIFIILIANLPLLPLPPLPALIVDPLLSRGRLSFALLAPSTAWS